VQPPTKPVLRRIVAAAAELAGERDVHEMLRIVLQFEPGLAIMSRDVALDLDTLLPITVWALERYVVRRFKELGRRLPDEPGHATFS
jgi:hypothetical protein